MTTKKDTPADSKPAEFKPAFGKKLDPFTPYVRWFTGLVVTGQVERAFENTSTYGSKRNIALKLLEDCTFTDGEGEVHEMREGDMLNVGAVAALSAVMTLEPGTKVQIRCIGKKKMGKGRQDAWEFEVYYE